MAQTCSSLNINTREPRHYNEENGSNGEEDSEEVDSKVDDVEDCKDDGNYEDDGETKETGKADCVHKLSSLQI